MMGSSSRFPRSISRNKGVSKAGVGAIVGGVFAGLFLIMAAVYYFLKRRQRATGKQMRRPPKDEEHELESDLPSLVTEAREGNVSANLGKEYSHGVKEGQAPLENTSSSIKAKGTEVKGTLSGGRLKPRN